MMKLIPSFPYRNLDGSPMKGCDHQNQTQDSSEIAVIQGVGHAIIAAGVPKILAHAGQEIETTWGCHGNKKMKSRKGTIYRVEVGLVRHPRSMFYKPQLFYYAHSSRHRGMVLTDFTFGDVTWQIPAGEIIPVTFALEWINDRTNEIENVEGEGVHFIRETATKLTP